MGDRRGGHHVERAGADRGGAGHEAAAEHRLGVGGRRQRHALFVVGAVSWQAVARLIERFADARHVAVAEDRPAPGDDRQRLAIDHRHLLRQKPHQRLRHCQAHRLADHDPSLPTFAISSGQMVSVEPSALSFSSRLPPAQRRLRPASSHQAAIAVQREPEIDQRANFAAISSTAASSPILPVSQRSAASAKIVRPTANPRTLSAVRAAAKLSFSVSMGASSPSSTTPRQKGSRAAITASIARHAATDACGSSFHQSGFSPAS